MADSTAIPNVTSALGVSSSLESINGDLHEAASEIAKIYVLSSDPYATEVFSLALAVDSQNVVPTFGRGALPSRHRPELLLLPRRHLRRLYRGAGHLLAGLSAERCHPAPVAGIHVGRLEGTTRADNTLEPGAPGGPENLRGSPSPLTPTGAPTTGRIPATRR